MLRIAAMAMRMRLVSGLSDVSDVCLACCRGLAAYLGDEIGLGAGAGLGDGEGVDAGVTGLSISCL